MYKRQIPGSPSRRIGTRAYVRSKEIIQHSPQTSYPSYNSAVLPTCPDAAFNNNCTLPSGSSGASVVFRLIGLFRSRSVLHPSVRLPCKKVFFRFDSKNSIAVTGCLAREQGCQLDEAACLLAG